MQVRFSAVSRSLSRSFWRWSGFHCHVLHKLAFEGGNGLRMETVGLRLGGLASEEEFTVQRAGRKTPEPWPSSRLSGRLGLIILSVPKRASVRKNWRTYPV
jgi:hypothetical protein